MSDEIAKLKELIKRHSDRSTLLPCKEGAHCVEFLSNHYDHLHLFSGIAKDELQRLSTKLEALKGKVDTIGNAMDTIQEHSCQYNVKNYGRAREAPRRLYSLDKQALPKYF